jgi:hypothetical protein
MTLGDQRSSVPPQVLRVRRTGGLAGRTVEGSLDLTADTPRSTVARDLVGRLDLTAATEAEPPFPDGYSYTFELGEQSLTVPQQHLSDDQRALAELLLSREP